MRQQTYLPELVPEASEILQGQKADQCAAICWQLNEAGMVDVLLITSRDTGRWVIPKGYIEKSEQLHKCARREALEEAGVVGRIGKKAIGFYSYLKDPTRAPYRVALFPLHTDHEIDEFKELGERRRAWLSPSEASVLVDEPELQVLFMSIAGSSPPKSSERLLRRPDLTLGISR
ncbi:NUDIX domain-containing protein [Rhizobium vallis]|uniref:NUDIX domain-containing protein n=1 Tax=Rhizobium vallis TaxID=634290 RepID=A0A3S0SPY9_9HYPH|nr:NUDIX hydrolase [Rhizobium vallis]RUM23935.1 NUDIX domain-containing protein [Rhizobium vallis]